MLNSVNIMGRLTAEPELRYTNNNIAYASFSLAVQRDRKDSSGTYPADFINCRAWRKTAEYISDYASKGCLAVVKGRLEQQTYKDKQGNSRSITIINVESIYLAEYKSSEGRKSVSSGSAADADFEEYADDDADSSLPF